MVTRCVLFVLFLFDVFSCRSQNPYLLEVRTQERTTAIIKMMPNRPPRNTGRPPLGRCACTMARILQKHSTSVHHMTKTQSKTHIPKNSALSYCKNTQTRHAGAPPRVRRSACIFACPKKTKTTAKQKTKETNELKERQHLLKR